MLRIAIFAFYPRRQATRGPHNCERYVCFANVVVPAARLIKRATLCGRAYSRALASRRETLPYIFLVKNRFVGAAVPSPPAYQIRAKLTILNKMPFGLHLIRHSDAMTLSPQGEGFCRTALKQPSPSPRRSAKPRPQAAPARFFRRKNGVPPQASQLNPHSLAGLAGAAGHARETRRKREGKLRIELARIRAFPSLFHKSLPNSSLPKTLVSLFLSLPKERNVPPLVLFPLVTRSAQSAPSSPPPRKPRSHPAT